MFVLNFEMFVYTLDAILFEKFQRCLMLIFEMFVPRILRGKDQYFSKDLATKTNGEFLNAEFLLVESSLFV